LNKFSYSSVAAPGTKKPEPSSSDLVTGLGGQVDAEGNITLKYSKDQILNLFQSFPIPHNFESHEYVTANESLIPVSHTPLSELETKLMTSGSINSQPNRKTPHNNHPTGVGRGTHQHQNRNNNNNNNNNKPNLSRNHHSTGSTLPKSQFQNNPDWGSVNKNSIGGFTRDGVFQIEGDPSDLLEPLPTDSSPTDSSLHNQPTEDSLSFISHPSEWDDSTDINSAAANDRTPLRNILSNLPTFDGEQPIQPPRVSNWYYMDVQGEVQGPFKGEDMQEWYVNGYFTLDLPVKREEETSFEPLAYLISRVGNEAHPFLTPSRASHLRTIKTPRTTRGHPQYGSKPQDSYRSGLGSTSPYSLEPNEGNYHDPTAYFQPSYNNPRMQQPDPYAGYSTLLDRHHYQAQPMNNFGFGDMSHHFGVPHQQHFGKNFYSAEQRPPFRQTHSDHSLSWLSNQSQGPYQQQSPWNTVNPDQALENPQSDVPNLQDNDQALQVEQYSEDVSSTQHQPLTEELNKLEINDNLLQNSQQDLVDEDESSATYHYDSKEQAQEIHEPEVPASPEAKTESVVSEIESVESIEDVDEDEVASHPQSPTISEDSKASPKQQAQSPVSPAKPLGTLIPPAPTTPVWQSRVTAKKSLLQIQQEEQEEADRRVQRQRAIERANTASNGSKRYADTVSKPTGGAWASVASSRPANSKSMPSTGVIPRSQNSFEWDNDQFPKFPMQNSSQPHGSKNLQSTKGNGPIDPENPPQPSAAFTQWAESTLKHINGIHPPDFIAVLLSFPLNPTSDFHVIVQETLYHGQDPNSTHFLDGGRFADEFIKRRKQDCGYINEQSASKSNASSATQKKDTGFQVVGKKGKKKGTL
jgi:hypothetical protein